MLSRGIKCPMHPPFPLLTHSLPVDQLAVQHLPASLWGSFQGRFTSMQRSGLFSDPLDAFYGSHCSWDSGDVSYAVQLELSSQNSYAFIF